VKQNSIDHTKQNKVARHQNRSIERELHRNIRLLIHDDEDLCSGDWVAGWLDDSEAITKKDKEEDK